MSGSSVTVPGFPAPLRLINDAQTETVSGDALTLQAGARTDWFIDPAGEVLVVSVVTRGESDDCNSVPIEGTEVWLRISRLGRAFAFHSSADGREWNMVRYFGLGDTESVEVGFLAQSPTGDGCTATFRDIELPPELLADVRSGV